MHAFSHLIAHTKANSLTREILIFFLLNRNIIDTKFKISALEEFDMNENPYLDDF